MFPTLRLILSASIATVVTVALVGSGVLLFLPAPLRFADVSEAMRPVRSIIEDAHPIPRFDTAGRRSEELRRLLSLPVGPSRAYAAEPPRTFPYQLDTTPVDEADDVGATDAALSPPPSVVAALPAPVAPVRADSTAAAAVETTSPNTEAPAEPAPGEARSGEVVVESEPVQAASPPSDATAMPPTKVVVVEPAATARPLTREAKPPVRSRLHAKAKKSRPALAERIRRPLPPPTEFETEQGHYPFLGYGNNWDNRNGWTTSGAQPAPQRRAAAPSRGFEPDQAAARSGEAE
jgi:hypothetical protein